jgi:hypothetical protein
VLVAADGYWRSTKPIARLAVVAAIGDLAVLPDVVETKAHTVPAARARPDRRIPPARSAADR